MSLKNMIIVLSRLAFKGFSLPDRLEIDGGNRKKLIGTN
jgi:hypothetical protein